jgi:hypothetical protein
MSTEHEQNGQAPQQPRSSDHALTNSILSAPDGPTKTDISAAKLEGALRHESDQRKTERFFWIFALIIAADALVSVVSAKALFGLVPLQLIILLGLAHWLEVDFVKKPLQQMLDRLSGDKKKP